MSRPIVTGVESGIARHFQNYSVTLYIVFIYCLLKLRPNLLLKLTALHYRHTGSFVEISHTKLFRNLIKRLMI